MAGSRRKRAKKKELPKRSRGRSKYEKALRKQMKVGRGGENGDDKSSSTPEEISSSSSSSMGLELPHSKRSRRAELPDSDTSDLAISLSTQMSVTGEDGGAGSQPTPSTSAQPPTGGVGRRPAPSVAPRPLPELPSSGPSRQGFSGGLSVVDARLHEDSVSIGSFSPNDDFHDNGSVSVSSDSSERNVRGNMRDPIPSSPSISPMSAPLSGSSSGNNGSEGSNEEVEFGEDDFDEDAISDLMREFRYLYMNEKWSASGLARKGGLNLDQVKWVACLAWPRGMVI